MKFLRPEQEFGSVEELRKAVEENKAQARDYFLNEAGISLN